MILLNIKKYNLSEFAKNNICQYLRCHIRMFKHI